MAFAKVHSGWEGVVEKPKNVTGDCLADRGWIGETKSVAGVAISFKEISAVRKAAPGRGCVLLLQSLRRMRRRGDLGPGREEHGLIKRQMSHFIFTLSCILMYSEGSTKVQPSAIRKSRILAYSAKCPS